MAGHGYEDMEPVQIVCTELIDVLSTDGTDYALIVNKSGCMITTII